MRLIQLAGPLGRRTAVVENGQIRLLSRSTSIFALANAALKAGVPLAKQASNDLSNERVDYDAIYAGGSDWRILPAIDQPDDPSRCMVSGTSLAWIVVVSAWPDIAA